MADGRPKPALPVPDDLEIAPGITVAVWKRLDLTNPMGADWDVAIRIFEHRIRSRFIEPANLLIQHEQYKERGTFGFAILALDCMVIETVQGFREGLINHGKRSKELVAACLQQGRFAGWFKTEAAAARFYVGYRCALHHTGQTDGDLRVRRSGPAVDRDSSPGAIAVNRTAFHDLVKSELADYANELRSGSNPELRENFRKKMNALCGVSPPIAKGDSDVAQALA
jgi:hypothetical protein